MMRRLPIVATLVVLAAIATMIWLGLWQIRRAHWKDALLASYQAAEGAPMLDGVPRGLSVDHMAFRRARIICQLTTTATQLGGRNGAGQSGFRNISGCRLADGRLLALDLGWSGVSEKPRLPSIGQRIDAVGKLIPDDVLTHRVIGAAAGTLPLLLVNETPAPGLQASVPPGIADIPNNHRSYAVQWFLFAGVAFVIFVLAAFKRQSLR